jgi:glycerophosphoryl diester phosphodiesterase
MKKLERNLLDEAILETGLSKEKSQAVVRNLRIGLVRQAAKDPGKKIKLDEAVLKQLKESVGIGANIKPDEADKVIEVVATKVRAMKDPQVKFLEDGTFTVSEDDDINFEMS